MRVQLRSLLSLSLIHISSNVLYYEMTDGAWVCVRPSGTEPKVKFYLGVKMCIRDRYIYAYDNKPEIVKKANQSEELLIYFSRGDVYKRQISAMVWWLQMQSS